MIKLIIRKRIKNYEDVSNQSVREAYGVLSGSLGLFCNFLLFLVKLGVGVGINSIAVISDAFNNLTDMASSLVAILGSKFSNKPADHDHPLGHGRYEYVASLVVAFIIMSVGLQLLKTSYEKILNPEIIVFSWLSLILLLISVVVKLWMYSYNLYIYKVINSSVIRATAFDSINDSIATSMVVVSMIIGHFFKLSIDGIAGVIISLLIMYSGFSVARDTVGLLLGQAPDPEVEERIYQLVGSGKNILGAHDLIIHDYGPGRTIASIHAEVPDNLSILEVHRAIDALEKRIMDQLEIDIVIHMDPVSTNQVQVETTENEIQTSVASRYPNIQIVNFRMVELDEKTNVLFDIIVDKTLSQEENDSLRQGIRETVNIRWKNYDVYVNEVLIRYHS
ncbi:cation diffusion facilitator family transporter [Eubacteriaceae bacterium ES3]|nr:cation diffusion facilitator family transporter [Eubacteriaceae bacterium ES3]